MRRFRPGMRCLPNLVLVVARLRPHLPVPDRQAPASPAPMPRAWLAALSLAIVMLACGSTSTSIVKSAPGVSPTPTYTTIPTVAPTVTPDPVRLLASNSPSADTDSSGNYHVYGALNCQQHTVLADHSAPYTTTEFQTLKTYFTATPQPALPSDLLTVAGAPTGPAATFLQGPCGGDLEVTYQGSGDATILGGGLRLISPPASNSYTYRTIDTCAMLNLPPDECVPYHSSAPCDLLVTSQLNSIAAAGLSAGAVGTDYLQPFDASGCQSVTLQRGQTADIAFSITSSVPLVFAVVPVLSVADGAGQHAVVFSRLINDLAFADTSQFPCYAPGQANTFAPTGKVNCT